MPPVRILAGIFMKNEKLIDSGKIVNTHGIRGEVKIEPWADSPQFLADFKTYYIDSKPLKVIRARVHKNMVIAQLEGINSIDEAELYRNKVIYIAREEAKLPEGAYFVSNLVGKTAFDNESGEELGKVTDIISLPRGSVMEITGKRQILVPVRDEFVISQDDESVKIHLIEGR